MKIQKPTSKVQILTGAFEISEASLNKHINFITNRCFPNNTISIVLSLFDGDTYIVNDPTELESLPVGDRRNVHKLSVKTTPQIQANHTSNNEFIEFIFNVRQKTLTIFIMSNSRVDELSKAAKQTVPHFKQRHSLLYHPAIPTAYPLFITIIFWLILFTLTPNPTTFFFCIFLFIFIAPYSLFLMFDGIILKFEEGRDRENFKKKIRNAVFGSTAISLAALVVKALK